MMNVWTKMIWIATMALFVGLAAPAAANDETGKGNVKEALVATDPPLAQNRDAGEAGGLATIPALAGGPFDWVPLSGGATCPSGFIVPSGCIDPAAFCACEASPDHILCCVRDHCNPNCNVPPTVRCTYDLLP